eukprot:82332_1
MLPASWNNSGPMECFQHYGIIPVSWNASSLMQCFRGCHPATRVNRQGLPGSFGVDHLPTNERETATSIPICTFRPGQHSDRWGNAHSNHCYWEDILAQKQDLEHNS